jgi:hypothetical protein
MAARIIKRTDWSTGNDIVGRQSLISLVDGSRS